MDNFYKKFGFEEEKDRVVVGERIESREGCIFIWFSCEGEV